MNFTLIMAIGYLTSNWSDIFGFHNCFYNEKYDRAQVLTDDKKARLILNSRGEFFIYGNDTLDNSNDAVVISLEDDWVENRDIQAIAEALVAKIEKSTDTKTVVGGTLGFD